MKFYGIDSVNPLRLGTPSNDDALNSLLVWDSSTGLVKYRNASSISGGGSGGAGTLEQTLIQGNDAGTYSIQFRSGESEIYSIIAGTSFLGFYENQPSILAITSSAFAFYPKISQNISGISILSSIIGGVAWNDIGTSGLSQQAWMKTQNANVDGFASVCLRNSQICILSCNTTTPYPYLSQMDMTVSGVTIESCDNTGQRTISTNQQSVDLFSSDGINSNSIILKGSSVCLNGSAGGDGQVVSINSSGQLCWSTAGGGGGGSGSTILNACEVGFGTGTGITSSSVFTFDSTYKIFNVAESSSVDANSCNSSIIGGNSNLLKYYSCNSSIVGGSCNTLQCSSCNTSIINGFCNTIQCNSSKSSIVGGFCNTIQCNSDYNSIVGGNCNTVQCSSGNSSIIGSYKSSINVGSIASVIVGGLCNQINSSVKSTTLGGQSNITNYAYYSSILGGKNNLLVSCNNGAQKNRVGTIIGGQRSCIICSSDSIIIGGASADPYQNLICGLTAGNTICGGQNNFVSGGYCNYDNIYGYLCNFPNQICFAYSSAILNGRLNLIQGSVSNSTILGGNSNIVSTHSCNSSIIGGQCNTLECNSCNSVILGGCGLTLSNECNVVYVPELKVSTASNDNALTKVLVWDEGTSNKMKWRDASTIGVGVCLPVYEIGFGNGSCITSNAQLTFNPNFYRLKLSKAGTISGNDTSIVGGYNNRMYYSPNKSTILGGYNNRICRYSYKSTIIGGDYNRINYSSSNSSIIGGMGGLICCDSKYSSIIGGKLNTIYKCSDGSSIVGGCYNCVCDFSCHSSIISGRGNKVHLTSNSTILGGCYNEVYGKNKDSRNNNTVIGGYCNRVCFSKDSTIIGGFCNNIGTYTYNVCNSAIIGGYNLTLLYNECNLVFVPELKVNNASQDDTLSRILVWDAYGTKRMKWRDSSTLGGGGSTILPSGEVGFGTGTGITSSNVFTFDSSPNIFKVSNNSTISANSCNSSMVGGSCNNISNRSYNSAIIGGFRNTLYYSTYSSIITSKCSWMCNQGCSTILGGYQNCIGPIFSCNTSIEAGRCNIINNNSNYSTIVNGICNIICDSGRASNIMGGSCNTIRTSSNQNTIFAGNKNIIHTYSFNSALVGGCCNCANNCVLNSSIISGCVNCINNCVCNSSIISGFNNRITTNSCISNIVGGCCNTLISTQGSSIVGGAMNSVCFSSCSSIVGGGRNTIQATSSYSSIVGGRENTLQCNSNYSSIVGGFCNTLQFSSRYSSIVGGGYNTLQCGSIQSSIIGGYRNTLQCNSGSSIVGGGCNTLQCNSVRSSIVGGFCNTLQCASCLSSIIGGCCNTLQSNSNNTVIIAGRGLSFSSTCDRVIVPSMIIASASTVRPHFNLVAGASVSSPTAGDIWFDGTSLYIRVGSTTCRIAFG